MFAIAGFQLTHILFRATTVTESVTIMMPRIFTMFHNVS